MQNTWPPPYTIRKSKRAKRISLAIKRQQLEIILPYYCPQKEALAALETHRGWVEQQLQKIAKHALHADELKPEKIILPSVEQTWLIHYIADSKRTRLLERSNQELVIFGDIAQDNICRELLRTWLRRQAEAILLPWLARLSEIHKLPYHSAAIRGQTTRWGSCSARGTINLNYKLLFLPTKLVEHILLHELCHTVHLHHGEKFWHLLRELDPQCDHLDHKSRRAQLLVPGWVETT